MLFGLWKPHQACLEVCPSIQAMWESDQIWCYWWRFPAAILISSEPPTWGRWKINRSGCLLLLGNHSRHGSSWFYGLPGWSINSTECQCQSWLLYSECQNTMLWSPLQLRPVAEPAMEGENRKIKSPELLIILFSDTDWPWSIFYILNVHSYNLPLYVLQPIEQPAHWFKQPQRRLAKLRRETVQPWTNSWKL